MIWPTTFLLLFCQHLSYLTESLLQLLELEHRHSQAILGLLSTAIQRHQPNPRCSSSSFLQQIGVISTRTCTSPGLSVYSFLSTQLDSNLASPTPTICWLAAGCFPSSSTATTCRLKRSLLPHCAHDKLCCNSNHQAIAPQAPHTENLSQPHSLPACTVHH